MQQPGWNAAAIKELAITWHPTTPRNFECQPGCLCCCVATLFFPSEAEKCPVEIQNGLEWRQGFIRAGRRPSGICMFFDEDASQHCTIFGHRPLRCRLYPYLPLITNEGIVIIADPLFTVSLPESDLPTWYRCYGLGCGPNVEAPIAQMSRDFLIRVADEYPHLMDTLCIDNVEHYLNRKEIDKNLHPMFPNWDRDLVRRQAGDW